jgi:hypothetical protein
MEVGGSEIVKKDAFEFPELNKALHDGFLANKAYPLYLFMGGQRMLLIITYN